MAVEHKSTTYKALPFKNPMERQDKVWSDILAEAEKTKRLYGYIALLCLAGFVAAVLIYYHALSTQEVVPIYVYVNEMGEARYMGQGKVQASITEAEIEFVLRDWTRKVRSIPGDADVLFDNIDTAYNYVTGKCEKKLTRDIRAANPFDLFGSVRCSVEIESLLKLRENQYQMDWLERVEGGSNAGVQKMRCIYTVVTLTPTAETIKVNPLGIYIDNYERTVIETRGVK